MGSTGLARQSVQDANASTASSNAAVTRSLEGQRHPLLPERLGPGRRHQDGKCKLKTSRMQTCRRLRKLDKVQRKAKVQEMTKQREGSIAASTI